MCISQTSEKAVPPTAMPITAAAKAAYEKSITAFMGALRFACDTLVITAAQAAPAAAQSWRRADELWRIRGSGFSAPRPPVYCPHGKNRGHRRRRSRNPRELHRSPQEARLSG